MKILSGAFFAAIVGLVLVGTLVLPQGRVLLSDASLRLAHEFPNEQGRLKQTALRLNPRNREARWWLLQEALQQNKRELAFLHLQSLIELFPHWPRGWLEMAKVLQSGGLLNDAELTITKAIQAAPEHAEARFLRAQLRLSQGRFASARRDIAVLEELEVPAWTVLQAQWEELKDQEREVQPPPRRGRGQFWPGDLGGLVGQMLQAIRAQAWDKAESLIEQAQQQYPHTMFGDWLAAMYALNRDDLVQAIQHLNQALEIAPRSHRVLSLLAQAWAKQDGAVKAAERLLDIAQDDPGFELAWVIATQAYMQARQYGHAENALRAALADEDAGIIPYKQLMSLYLTLDQSGEAWAICQQGLARYPQNLELLQMQAELLWMRQDKTQAAQAWEQLLAVDADNNLTRARLMSVQSDAARIESLAQQLEADHPHEAEIWDLLGQSYDQLGREQDAGHAWRQAEALQPQHPGIQYRLASWEAQQAQWPQAQQRLSALLATGREFKEKLAAQKLQMTVEQKINE